MKCCGFYIKISYVTDKKRTSCYKAIQRATSAEYYENITHNITNTKLFISK